MNCPQCRLINPDTALRCDCGYDFPSGKMRDPLVQPKRVKLPKLRWLLLYLAIVCAQGVSIGFKDGLGRDPLTVFLPTIMGGAFAPYFVGCLVGLFSKRETRFHASAAISGAIWALNTVTEWNLWEKIK